MQSPDVPLQDELINQPTENRPAFNTCMNGNISHIPQIINTAVRLVRPVFYNVQFCQLLLIIQTLSDDNNNSQGASVTPCNFGGESKPFGPRGPQRTIKHMLAMAKIVQSFCERSKNFFKSLCVVYISIIQQMFIEFDARDS